MSTPSPPKVADWGLERDSTGDVHIFPINDLLAHEDNDTCPCVPFIEIHTKTFKYLVVHNAWDGRE
jgi:hypothetical protein